jgi:hypothetical protein
MANAIIQDGVIVGTTATATDFTTEINDELVKYHMGKDLVVAMKDHLIEYTTTLFEAEIALLNEGYPSSEKGTFAVQQTEWAAWNADNTASTPFVDALATARGMTKADLMAKIGTNVTAIATAVGNKQSRVDAINACTTYDALVALEL